MVDSSGTRSPTPRSSGSDRPDADDLSVVVAGADAASAFVVFECGIRLGVKRLKSTWAATLDVPGEMPRFAHCGRRREAAAEEALRLWTTWLRQRT